ncbi:hypothetical protein DIPPA_10136 [Diplonema papillatum]|nr:hypothetical protein DIPPA_10136 [Diplonema papillatum]
MWGWSSCAVTPSSTSSSANCPASLRVSTPTASSVIQSFAAKRSCGEYSVYAANVPCESANPPLF